MKKLHKIGLAVLVAATMVAPAHAQASPASWIEGAVYQWAWDHRAEIVDALGHFADGASTPGAYACGKLGDCSALL